jgi:OOP family OmpA-OmpF porin
MDGIPDYMDEDPFTGKGAKVDAKGRELDSDGDGVPDSRDQEANTPKGALVDANGRQIKNVGGGGGVSDAVLPQVFFATNGTSISAANAERLATIARVLASNENLTLTVTGHTDKTGSEAYNRKLGERRAKAVIDYMVRNYGIDASRLEAVSAGEDSPLSTQLLNINRRVEFNIK